jgi:hypothetical protein
VTHLLSIVDGKLVVYDRHDNISAVIDTDAKLDAFLAANDEFLVSSSIDFPTEYTSDPVVLALVARVRG